MLNFYLASAIHYMFIRVSFGIKISFCKKHIDIYLEHSLIRVEKPDCKIKKNSPTPDKGQVYEESGQFLFFPLLGGVYLEWNC